MKKITPEVVLKIQNFLRDSSIFYGTPSENWSAQAINALKEYRRRKGTKFPEYTLMPNSVDALPEELQKYIQDKESADAIEVVGTEESIDPSLELSQDHLAPLQLAPTDEENNPSKETTGEALEDFLKGAPDDEGTEEGDDIEIVTKAAPAEPAKQESAPEAPATAPVAPVAKPVPTTSSKKKKKR